MHTHPSQLSSTYCAPGHRLCLTAPSHFLNLQDPAKCHFPDEDLEAPRGQWLIQGDSGPCGSEALHFGSIHYPLQAVQLVSLPSRVFFPGNEREYKQGERALPGHPSAQCSPSGKHRPLRGLKADWEMVRTSNALKTNLGWRGARSPEGLRLQNSLPLAGAAEGSLVLPGVP